MTNNELVLSAIDKAVKYNATFFAYKLPNDGHLHFGAQIIEQVTAAGFLIHPFVADDNTPAVFISDQISAEKFVSMPVSVLPDKRCRPVEEIQTLKEEYIAQAAKTISSLRAGEYRKIVLSRTIVEPYTGIMWNKVFESLVNDNPNAFVFIFNTDETGFWIGASPEKYLRYREGTLSTVSLAGTRLAGSGGDWSPKDIEEQSIVTEYITEKFTNAGIDVNISSVYNRAAGNVEHLCNDFESARITPTQVDVMLNSLHPTPAIAGIPTSDAIKFIRSTELHDRRYYGGYTGPVDADGNFDFYVNLRSLQFDNSKYCMYAGGGLTADSVPEQEWQETVYKSKVLLKYL